MRRDEIISLMLVIAAVVILIIGIKMDNVSVSYRQWLVIPFVLLLIFAIDPKGLNKWKKTKVEEHIETEEDEMGFIELRSEEPVDKNTLNRSDAYLTFQDKQTVYYIHFVDGEAYEIYTSEPCVLARLDYDELDEDYQTLDDLFETAEVEGGISTISAEDFRHVRKRYQVFRQSSSPELKPSKPVNRVGRALGYTFGVFALVVFCAIPFMPNVEFKTKIFVLINLAAILLFVVYSFFTPQAWLFNRIKWLGGKIKRITWVANREKLHIEVSGSGKEKSFQCMDSDNLIQYEYRPKQKQLIITKTIQISLDDVKGEFNQRQEACKEFTATHDFIEFYKVPFFDWLGTYSFSFTIHKSKATKTAMKELREWLSQPIFDSSNVCEYFKYNEFGGTFFIKYQNCSLAQLVYVHEDGEIESLDPSVDTPSNKDLSDEIKCFYIDFEDFYCWKIKEEHRIEAGEWPI